MKRKAARSCIAIILFSILAAGCASLDRTERTALLGSEAGGSIGALIGKRAGNPVVGATIGAAIGGSTGAFLARRLDGLTDSRFKSKTVSPLIVINGIPYKRKEAQSKLSRISSSQIESVVLLKHEQAIALYGQKGEHGALLIMLKRQG